VVTGARLTSATSDRVKAVRALHSRSGRRKAARFLVEGPQAVRSALDAGVVIHDLFVDDDAGVAHAGLVADARAQGVRVTEASPGVLAAMGETEHPQGVLAVCALLPAVDLDVLMARPGPVVVLEALADPGNVGTVIRTADAAGAAGVVLTPGSADVHNGKVVRATAGSLFHLPVRPDTTLDDVVTAARAAGRPVAVTAGQGAEDLFEAAGSGRVGVRTCWLVGAEAHGATPAALAAADLTVRIPMTGRAESLNAAVASAVVLYVTAYSGRTRDRGFGAAGPEMTDLSHESG
jgi:TrmH family RNA methyltransferase